MPTAVTMPWTVAHPAAPGGKAPGQHGGWLGKGFDPFRVEGDPNAAGFRVGGLGLPDDVTPDRLRGRRALLGTVGSGPDLAGAGPARGAGSRPARSTRSSRPRRGGRSRSSGKTRRSATATAGISTANACCWPAAWSRRASAS